MAVVSTPTIDATEARTKGARTRARLLQGAIRRFAAEGYRRASVSDIARDAGLTPAAAYAYFAGKEALFEAAVDADAAALIDEARRAVGDGPVRERELAFVGALIDLVDGHPLARRVLGGLEPEVVHRLLDLPSLKAVRDECARDLADAQRAGDVRADVDAAALASGLESVVLALLMGHVQTGAARDATRAAGVVALLDAALRAPAR
jgi:AcrR family transcriptional regulator